MPFVSGYKIQFDNVEDVRVEINIYDRSSGMGSDDTVFTELTAGADPLHLFTINNEEEKYSPIKALQAEIKFLSTAATNLTTFIDNDDNRWYVEILIGGSSVPDFKGFLVTDDCDQDFLDNDADNEITLIATDAIGLLKDIPLTDFDSDNPRGFFSLIKYISYCLKGTGIELNINVCHNLREENTPTQVMYQSCYLDARTFEQEINESEDSYSVLEKILGQDAFIVQARGEYWVIRIDELAYGNRIRNVFDLNGSSAGAFTELMSDYELSIGPTEDMYFSERVTFVKAQQSFREVRLTYDYEYWKEIIDNIEWDRGEEFATGIADTRGWTVAEWDFRKNLFSATAVSGTETRGYFRESNIGGEFERYLVIEDSTTNADYYFSSNKRLLVRAKDKFYFSVDHRYKDDIAGTSGNLTIFTAQLRLHAFDGTYWTLFGGLSVDPQPRWVQTNAAFSGLPQYISYQSPVAADQSQWSSVSVEAPPIPRSGELQVLLIHADSAGSRERRFQNLRFDYIPYINGSYQRYRAQQNTITQANSKKSYSEKVALGDTQVQVFKGALHRQDGSRFIPTGNFYDGLQFGSTVPADAFLHPFNYNQAFSVWNQHNRPFRIFDFQVQGIRSSSGIPSPIYRYLVNDASEHTDNKQFMMLHYDMDLKLCSWKGVMIEINDTTIERDYASPFELKYITER